MNETDDRDPRITNWLQAAGPQDVRAGAVDEALTWAVGVPQRRGAWARRFGAGAWPSDRRRLALSSRTIRLVAVMGVLIVIGGSLLVAGARTLVWSTPTIDGAFTAGPSLPAGQSAVSAVALQDGRVLVGVRSPETDTGSGALQCTAPCRPHLSLLDPASGDFTLTRDLPPSLPVDSMTLLQDGRVLLVGAGEAPTHRSVWIYDPVTDSLEQVAGPLEARFGAFLVTLADGRVLLGGGSALGRGSARSALASTQIFDPATGEFTFQGPEMTRPRGPGATATLVDDGRVLIIGGDPESDPSAELYDPATGQFTATGATTTPRVGLHTATRLPDGRVLIAGGLIPDPIDPTTVPRLTSAAEVYDPVTGRFTAVGPMAAPRFMHGAVLLRDGTVLVVGGTTRLGAGAGPDAMADAEIFDPSTGTFRATGSLLHPRLMPVVVATDGRVLVLGDIDQIGDDPATAATTEWFD